MDLLSQLTDSHSSFLRRLAGRYGLSADDLFQEVWRGLEAEGKDWSLPQPRIIRRRALFVARNLARAERRHRRSREGAIVETANDHEPIEDAILSERKQRVRSALARLPKRDRVLIRLRTGKELGFRQIGEVLGITPQAARQRFQRLKLQLLSDLA